MSKTKGDISRASLYKYCVFLIDKFHNKSCTAQMGLRMLTTRSGLIDYATVTINDKWTVVALKDLLRKC